MRVLLGLVLLLSLAGCQDDPWVRLNVGAANLRWVPPGTLATAEQGPWTAATLRPEDAEWFTSGPLTVLLHEGDRPPEARTDREWLTRSVSIGGLADAERALAFVPLVEALRTDTSGVQHIEPLAEGRARVTQTMRREAYWATGETAVYVREPSGRWNRDAAATPRPGP